MHACTRARAQQSRTRRDATTDDTLATCPQADALARELSRPGECAVDFEQFSALLCAEAATRRTSPRHASLMQSLRPVNVPAAAADAELDSAFALFDADGDGYVSLEDARKLLRSMGTLADEDTLAALLASADANGDGRLSRAEFGGLLGQPPQ